MEEENVTVEPTTEVIEPETTTEETTEVEAPAEGIASEETIETPAETQEVEAEKPKRTSRASERIRELVAQKKELEAQLRHQQPQAIEGFDETGIDPTTFAESVTQKATRTAANAAVETLKYYEAETKYPLVKDNSMVRSRASVLVDEGYDPIAAAELATLEWKESTAGETRKSSQRMQASANMRSDARIPSAGKAVKTSDTFSRAEIARMTPQEYTKNASAIQAQLEKYGPDSFE